MEIKEKIEHIKYLIEYLGREYNVPHLLEFPEVEEYIKEKGYTPGLLEELEELLFALCSSMEEDDKRDLIYDGSIREARKLADWLDEYTYKKGIVIQPHNRESDQMAFVRKHFDVPEDQAEIIGPFIDRFVRIAINEDHPFSYKILMDCIVALCREKVMRRNLYGKNSEQTKQQNDSSGSTEQSTSGSPRRSRTFF